jgi:hypothetical protein
LSSSFISCSSGLAASSSSCKLPTIEDTYYV